MDTDEAQGMAKSTGSDTWCDINFFFRRTRLRVLLIYLEGEVGAGLFQTGRVHSVVKETLLATGTSCYWMFLTESVIDLEGKVYCRFRG